VTALVRAIAVAIGLESLLVGWWGASPWNPSAAAPLGMAAGLFGSFVCVELWRLRERGRSGAVAFCWLHVGVVAGIWLNGAGPLALHDALRLAAAGTLPLAVATLLHSAGARRVCHTVALPRRVADSVVFGAWGLMAGLAFDAATGLDSRLREQLPLAWVTLLVFPGAQVLGMVNLFFVARDAARHQGKAAVFGFILSLAAAAHPFILRPLAR
jgi:hypothetical protein